MASKTVKKEIKSTPGKGVRTASRKTVYRSSINGRFTKNDSSNKKSEMSESDKLTLRAWKHTYANRHKSED
jgi:hypothetical protein